jgi:type IV pilus assembly protein PilA
MNHKSRTLQGGFSLVELMVVVAIIGVLASIAVPAVNKYIAKARQSEAKTGLSSLYTSEKAFYAEYTAYHSAFEAIGYSPEGRVRYNVGFSAAGTVAGPASGFNTVIANPAIFNTSAYCVAAGGAMTMAQPCSVMNGADGAAPGAIAATVLTSTAFTAGAIASIHAGAAASDAWTMDQNKSLTNTTNGIP